jgi:hypothetical protein
MPDQSEGTIAQQSGEEALEELGVADNDFSCSSKASNISLSSSETFSSSLSSSLSLSNSSGRE